MKLWDKIKQMLGINQPKQLQAPQEENQYGTNFFRESMRVDTAQLDQARAEQQREQQKDFQAMFAMKNLCGKGINLFGNDFAITLQSTLQRYGYSNELQLDQLDLEILSRANMSLNMRSSEKITDYINNSQDPTGAVKVLMAQAREKSIQTAQQWQCTEKEAYRYVPTNMVAEFEQTIEEEKSKEEQSQENGL